MAPRTLPTSMRLTEDAKVLQRLLSEHMGVSQHAVMELAIRALAEQKGIKIEEKKDATITKNSS